MQNEALTQLTSFRSVLCDELLLTVAQPVPFHFCSRAWSLVSLLHDPTAMQNAVPAQLTPPR